MNILNFLTTVKDYRNDRGKRYNLPSILCLLLSGLLSGNNSIASIHRWGKSLSKNRLKQLGFYDQKLISYSNLTVILKKVDGDDIARIMNELAQDSERQILNIDGKFLKNSNCFGEKEQAQILTMFNNQKGATVGYQEIEGKDEYKAMLKLLEKSNIKDAIITADAAFTHQEITEKIVARGADFAISLKGNEANLLYQTENLFNEAEEKKIEIRTFKEEINCNHGRIEQRSIEVVDMPWEYLNGHKHIKQLCKITRFREYKNKSKPATAEIAHMVTSLDKSYSPEYLLKLNRGHWSCENNLNWVKDNVFFEDKSTISVGVSPLIMSLLRSLSIQIIKTISNKITETREMFSHTQSLLWKKIAIFGCDF